MVHLLRLTGLVERARKAVPSWLTYCVWLDWLREPGRQFQVGWLTAFDWTGWESLEGSSKLVHLLRLTGLVERARKAVPSWLTYCVWLDWLREPGRQFQVGWLTAFDWTGWESLEGSSKLVHLLRLTGLVERARNAVPSWFTYCVWLDWLREPGRQFQVGSPTAFDWTGWESLEGSSKLVHLLRLTGLVERAWKVVPSWLTYCVWLDWLRESGRQFQVGSLTAFDWTGWESLEGSSKLVDLLRLTGLVERVWKAVPSWLTYCVWLDWLREPGRQFQVGSLTAFDWTGWESLEGSSKLVDLLRLTGLVERAWKAVPSWFTYCVWLDWLREPGRQFQVGSLTAFDWTGWESLEGSSKLVDLLRLTGLVERVWKAVPSWFTYCVWLDWLREPGRQFQVGSLTAFDWTGWESLEGSSKLVDLLRLTGLVERARKAVPSWFTYCVWLDWLRESGSQFQVGWLTAFDWTGWESLEGSSKLVHLLRLTGLVERVWKPVPSWLTYCVWLDWLREPGRQFQVGSLTAFDWTGWESLEGSSKLVHLLRLTGLVERAWKAVPSWLTYCVWLDWLREPGRQFQVGSLTAFDWTGWESLEGSSKLVYLLRLTGLVERAWKAVPSWFTYCVWLDWLREPGRQFQVGWLHPSEEQTSRTPQWLAADKQTHHS